MFKRKFKDWPIVRTIAGKNKTGKKLNKVLPFKKQREIIGSILLGISDVTPMPKPKDAEVREKIETIRLIVEQAKFERVGDAAEKAILTIADLIDDGKLNKSATLTPNMRKKIRLYSSCVLFAIIVYEFASVFTGWPSILNNIIYIIEVLNG